MDDSFYKVMQLLIHKQSATIKQLDSALWDTISAFEKRDKDVITAIDSQLAGLLDHPDMVPTDYVVQVLSALRTVLDDGQDSIQKMREESSRIEDRFKNEGA